MKYFPGGRVQYPEYPKRAQLTMQDKKKGQKIKICNTPRPRRAAHNFRVNTTDTTHLPHAPLVALEHADQLQVRGLPELDGAVLRRARDDRVVWRHGHAVHVLLVSAHAPPRRLQQRRRRRPHAGPGPPAPLRFPLAAVINNCRSRSRSGRFSRISRCLLQRRYSAARYVPALEGAVGGPAHNERRCCSAGGGAGGVPRAWLLGSGDRSDGVRVAGPAYHRHAQLHVPQEARAVFRRRAQVSPERGGGGGERQVSFTRGDERSACNTRGNIWR